LAFGSDDPLEPVALVADELGDAVLFFEAATALGPSAGSLPEAICVAIKPPISSVAMTARSTSFVVSAPVVWRGARR
jgi:hypothetical protein